MARQDQISTKLIFVFAAVIGSIFFFLIAVSNNEDDLGRSILKELNPEELDLMAYYINATKLETADTTSPITEFTVSDIYVRIENNFLQGFYFD